MLTTAHCLFFLQPVDLTVFIVQDYSPHSVMQAADMNRSLPPMSTFHRNNAAPRTPSLNVSESAKGDDIWKYH